MNIHRQALDLLQEIPPESLEDAERANHFKVTYEALRKHLGMLQNHRQEDGGLSESE